MNYNVRLFAFFIAVLTLFLKALKRIQVSLDPALDARFFALSLSNINFLRSGVSQGEFVFRTFFRRKGACETHIFINIFPQKFQATLGSVIFSTDCHGARAKSHRNMVVSKFLSCLLFTIVGAPAGMKAFLMAQMRQWSLTDYMRPFSVSDKALGIIY